MPIPEYDIITPDDELRNQLKENEAQLRHLYSLHRATLYQQVFLAVLLLLACLSLVLFACVAIYPAGRSLVQTELYGLSGSICVFLTFGIVLLCRHFGRVQSRSADLYGLARQQERAIAFGVAALEGPDSVRQEGDYDE